MGDTHFPRTSDLPSHSPMYWVGQKDRFLRQQLIRDIEVLSKRRLVVYFANRFRDGSGIDAGDPAYITEMLSDVGNEPVDLLIETNGGATDATEAIISILQLRIADLRVVIANGAKSNGTLICLAAKSIVMGPSSELGPIDPHLQGIPCTVLVQPQVAVTNFPLQQLAELGLKQTRKLATRLLGSGMMKGHKPEDIEAVVNSLATRDTYFSHGSTIDCVEAASLGLIVEKCDQDDPFWSRIWLLYCMYDYDTRRDNLLKVFEGRARSIAVAAPNAAP